MEEHKPYRHELKYSLSYTDYLTIRNRIRNLMSPDPHTGPDGRYRARRQIQNQKYLFRQHR